MANLNSSIYALLGASSTGISDSAPMYFALALSDSKDGYVTIQIDDESYMNIFLEEDEVECDVDESLENNLDNFYEEVDDEYEEEDSEGFKYENENASDEIDEEG